MFKIPRVNVIESDEGFSVEVLGMTGLLYTEGKKKLLVDSEVIASPKGLMIYRGSIKKWDDPYSSEQIDDKKRQQIVENIQRAFSFRGFDIDIY